MTIIQKAVLNIKNGDGSYTNSKIRPACSNDDVLAFAEAYNSLQKNIAGKFIKTTTSLITLV